MDYQRLEYKTLISKKYHNSTLPEELNKDIYFGTNKIGMNFLALACFLFSASLTYQASELQTIDIFFYIIIGMAIIFCISGSLALKHHLSEKYIKINKTGMTLCLPFQKSQKIPWGNIYKISYECSPAFLFFNTKTFDTHIIYIELKKTQFEKIVIGGNFYRDMKQFTSKLEQYSNKYDAEYKEIICDKGIKKRRLFWILYYLLLSLLQIGFFYLLLTLL